MKNFDFTEHDNDSITEPSLFSRIRAKFTFRKKKQQEEPEPSLPTQDSQELKGLIDSLTKEPLPKLIEKAMARTPERPVITEELALPILVPVTKKPWVRFANTIIGIIALLVGAYGVMVLYNQLPTYPMLVVGIVAIAASSGVITGITARG
jgi:hypothetical protein